MQPERGTGEENDEPLCTQGPAQNKRAILLVFLSVRGVTETVTYLDMRPFPRLADKQKSCAI